MVVVLLGSSITGTRPRAIVPPKSVRAASEEPSAENEMAGQKRRPKKGLKKLDDFQSDMPKYVRYDDIPPTLYYHDIDLFMIRNPEGGSDVVVAVVDFVTSRAPNKVLKGKSKHVILNLILFSVCPY
jgi:hypothetical protein